MISTLCRSLLLATLAMVSRAVEYKLEAGADFEVECLMLVEPGDSCYLSKGDYEHDGLTRTHGTEDSPITIHGHPEACIKGSNTQDRVFQVAHNYYTIKDICFDGSHGNDYVSTAIYVLGADRKNDFKANGVEVKSSVTGLVLSNLEIKNFGSECIHFRYFVTWAEMEGCTVQHCGVDAFENGGSGKVGEALYIGTALDQVDDDKAPEVKLRGSSSADNVDFDVCSYNWIHHNTFRTYGNECVDVKEGSTLNLIENNVCEQQKDENSGGFGLRGSENTVRYNEINECDGAGIRVGGDRYFGTGNNMYGNVIKNTGNGAFSVQKPDQGVVCENSISGTTASEGAYKDEPQFVLSVSTGDCDTYPGDLDGSNDSSPPETAPDTDDSTTDDDDINAGVNGNEDEQSEQYEVETNAQGTSGMGECPIVLPIAKMEIEHADYVDEDLSPNNLFDEDLDTYYSVHRESTKLTFELEGEYDVSGVSIGFFMKDSSEERIQTFDIAVKSEDDDGWTTVQSRQESSGEFDVMQTFPFTSRKATYVRFESHGNNFNNWTPLTEFEICGTNTVAESNALFGGLKDSVKKDIDTLNSDLSICPEPAKLAPHKVRVHGGSGNVAYLFDGNYQTRWSTENTFHDDDINNDKVQLTFVGDSYISYVKIAFFDGHLAPQVFGIYTQSATAKEWEPASPGQIAAMHEGLQTFDINTDKITYLYLVGNGNTVGDFTKISEIEVYGC